MSTHEELYADMVFGCDEPDMMIANGAHFKWMFKKLGMGVPKDTHDNCLSDGVVYLLTKDGFEVVE
jgi:hypothetical protein